MTWEQIDAYLDAGGTGLRVMPVYEPDETDWQEP